MVNTLGDDGREKVRNAVAATAASREARAATRQQETDIIPPRHRGRRRDDPAECAVAVAGCGGGIGRRERKAWRELREERAAGRQRTKTLLGRGASNLAVKSAFRMLAITHIGVTCLI
jgi:hypothetical protein